MSLTTHEPPRSARATPATVLRDLRLAWAAMGFALLCMAALAALRGVWLDELWTLWLTGRDLPLREALTKRWSFEPHPPLFYLWIWSARHVLPTIVPLLRWTNLAGLVSLLGAAALARRHGADRRFVTLYMLLVVSSPVVVVYFAELRSYFLQVTLLAGLVLLLERVHFASADLARRDRALAVAIPCWLLLAANLHYLTAAVCLTTVGMEALNQLRRRHWRFAGLLIVAMLAAILCLVPPLRHYLSLGTVSSPVLVSSGRAALIMGLMIAVGIGANVAAFLFAARGLWRAAPAERASTLTYTVEILLAIGIVAIAFAVLNIFKHFLVPRYTLQLVALGAAPVAFAAREAVGARWFRLVPANAMLLAGAAAAMQGTNKRWDYNVARIRAEVAACPTTRILALDSIALTNRVSIPRAGEDPTATLRAIMANGYAYIGSRNGFTTTLVPQPGPPSRIAPGCPTIVWLESNYYRDRLTADEMMRAANLVDDPATIAAKRVDQSGDHALLYILPKGTDAKRAGSGR